MRQKKKVCLMHCIGREDIKLWPRNVAWRWEIFLPKRLFNEPFFCHIFCILSRCSQLFHSGKTFTIAFGAVVDLGEFGIQEFTLYIMCLKKAKGCIPKRKHARTNEQNLTILLLWAGLVEVRKLGFFGKGHLCPVHLIEEGQCSVSILEIVSPFIFHLIIFCNPV